MTISVSTVYPTTGIRLGHLDFPDRLTRTWFAGQDVFTGGQFLIWVYQGWRWGLFAFSLVCVQSGHLSKGLARGHFVGRVLELGDSLRRV